MAASALSVSVKVDRSSLGLSELECNDGDIYRLSSTIEPGQIAWRRQQVESPFVDGKVTVHRVKDDGEMRLVFWVLGTNQATLRDNVETLIEAFTQPDFTVTVTIDGTIYKWTCEAADYAMSWEHVEIHNRQLKVGFQMPRRPTPVTGPF